MIVQTSSGQLRIADQPFARGGEGCIHDIEACPQLVAKIYHPKGRNAQRERKLQAMLRYPPEDTLKGQIAWPVEILYDTAGGFLGFTMPRIRNVTKIDILYSYDKRGEHSWGWYIQVAQNLCAAIYGVHKSGHACGDLNPANICVEEKTGLVTLVDTDSYHINAHNGQVFPCVVCMPAYVPAELHRLMNRPGMDLRTTTKPTFNQQTDLFALAVHIFALLMNGCHPFACIAPAGFSASQFQLIGNIEAGLFAFTKNTQGAGIPKYAPPLTILTPKLQQLFIRAFCAGHINPLSRPRSEEWYTALEELEQQLVRCPKNKAHTFYGTGGCPWCPIEATMRRVLGPPKPAPPPPPPKPAPAQPAASSGGSGKVSSGWLPSLPLWMYTIPTLLFYLLAIALWAGSCILGMYLLSRVPLNTWWWGILRYVLYGITPFWLLWAVRLLRFIPIFYWVLEDFEDLLSEYSRWAAFLVYGGVALVAVWGHGLFNMIVMPLVACLPIYLINRWFPFLTS